MQLKRYTYSNVFKNAAIGPLCNNKYLLLQRGTYSCVIKNAAILVKDFYLYLFKLCLI